MAKDGKDTANSVAANQNEPGSGSFVVSNGHVTFALLMATAVLVLANLATQIVAIRRGEARPSPSCSISARDLGSHVVRGDAAALPGRAVVRCGRARAFAGPPRCVLLVRDRRRRRLHEHRRRKCAAREDEPRHEDAARHPRRVPRVRLGDPVHGHRDRARSQCASSSGAGLPDRPRRFLALGALLFVFGAVSFELVQGEIVDNPDVSGGRHGYVFLATVTIEETLEFVGVISPLTAFSSTCG